MNKAIGGLVVCLLSLVACNVEHYEDCNGDELGDGDAFGGSHSRAGSSSTSTSGKAGSTSASAGTASGGAAAGTGGTGSAGTAAATAGGEGGAPVVVPPDSCEAERDCDRGYNCDLDVHQCLPAAEETCGELDTELACTHRSDCTPIYGGTNCSCGQDCECHGGDPGCVCENFEFFVCRAAE